MKFNLRGWAIIFDSQDLENEYFHQGTKFGRAINQELDLFFEHGYNPRIGKQPIGQAKLSLHSRGVLAEAAVDAPDKVGAMLKRLLAADMLGFSTGAGGHLVDKTETDKGTAIDQWQLCELSLVAQPAEPGAYAQLKASLVDLRANHERRMEEIRLAESHRRALLNHLRVKNLIRAHELGINPKTGEVLK